MLAVIRGMKNTPALGEDSIPAGIVKDLAQVLAPPLAHVVGRSFASSKIPALFKKALITPIYKKGKDPMLPGSYRPVVILCTLSKVLEGVVLRQFAPFLTRHLPTQQWGFMRGRSTVAALAAAQGSWTRPRSRGRRSSRGGSF